MRLEFRSTRPSRILSFIVCAFLLAAMSAAIAAGEPESATTGTAKKEAEKKWDVSNPPGPFDAVEIATDEGTWMSLDVSPDGKTIVFDLLGDICRVPIGGGDAEALTSGVAWDMQPCYSPDGRRIAFTSDRGGGDNIWIMDRDGSHAKQVTKEDFRLVNSPAWAPDSQYIAARKHFTSKRSLGAGEIWLYHISGGEGVQMTKRPNDQKDLGEPAFSPDGRYLYFSQDVTSGRVFEYNKDPNGEIYAIKRLDREKGETEDFVSDPGGSIRPTPSPDGRYLAFVRRVRYKSTLFLHEIESGRERPLYDGLDRDMQETWAIHGVYPHMAWTPALIRVTKANPPGTYDIRILPKKPKNGIQQTIWEPRCFAMKVPEVGEVTYLPVEQKYRVTGRFFGTKKGKIYLGELACKVKTWTMNKATNESEATFLLPKGVTSGTFMLNVVNKVGWGKKRVTLPLP